MIRRASYARAMHNAIPPEGSGVPEKIKQAERWRLAGERLHALSPELFERVYNLLAISIPDENEEKITESYFLT